MTLRGGAIIIGSLLWDNEKEKREKWRDNRLCYEDRFQVYLPIRYGRLSEKRKNTYTMVFSKICYKKGYELGTGWILPIRAGVNSFDDLKVEAQEMGKAEGFSDGFSSNWGSVALFLNPNKEIDSSIRTKWTEHISCKISTHSLLKHWKSGQPPIDRNGFLTIRWPEEVTPKNRIEKLDFLIATVTVPKLINDERYPTEDEIAKAMNRKGYYDYFLKNRKHGITTFQDKRILGLIPKSDP